MLYLCS